MAGGGWRWLEVMEVAGGDLRWLEVAGGPWDEDGCAPCFSTVLRQSR